MPVFWNAVATRLADRWVAHALPASVCWLGLVAAWYAGHGGHRALSGRLDALAGQPGAVQVTLLLAVLAGVAASATVVQRLTFPVLRLLEGDWPSVLGLPRRALVSLAVRRRATRRSKWNALTRQAALGTITAADRLRRGRLEQWLRRRPVDVESTMPTRFGNTLRAAMERPRAKYGLDASVVWPHMWCLLPEQTRENLAAARRQVDSAAAAGLWGLLALPAGLWTPWAAVIAGAVVVVCWGWLLPHAGVDFADLLEAAFDLHRAELYRALRWPLPANPQAERVAGERVTEYLHRGLADSRPAFVRDA
ncbi:hypothetical protein [Streptomyces sp. NPDC001348]